MKTLKFIVMGLMITGSLSISTAQTMKKSGNAEVYEILAQKLVIQCGAIKEGEIVMVTELIAGIILWKMGLNRGELRFIEFRPIPESFIFASAGLLIGFLQWTILRRYFYKSGYWIFACILGWGICIIVTQISIWAFFMGALLYGAITGAALLWIMQIKEVQR